MTATHVDGHAVIADEAVPVLGGYRGGRTQQQYVRRLTLDDGTQVYGCGADRCDHTTTDIHHLLAHVAGHRGLPIIRTPRGPRPGGAP